MPYIRDSFFAGREFSSLTQMQADAVQWATEVYGAHKHRGLDGQTPTAVFTALERDALMPLPPRPFESVIYGVGRVTPDCHVKSGVGKIHVAQALGHQVARRGGDIRFVKCSRMLADLAGGHADRTIGQRMREYTRPLVLIVDDFAMREHTPTQSDDLYDLVSDRAITAKPLILTSNRAPKDWYPLFPNPVVAESLLDRLINTSHQVNTNGTQTVLG